MESGAGITIRGVDVLEVLKFVIYLGKKYQAITLSELEEVLGKDTPEFARARKVVLDNFNNYSRSILAMIFGDIDYSW